MSTYYVGVGGNDANNGLSWANRKLTLNGAEDIPVAAGDTVYVGPGTYRESLTVDVSGTAGNVITYIGDYTGANTSGTKGIVRITGSADDIATTRGTCITSTAKSFRTFRGFLCDTTSAQAMIFQGTVDFSDITVDNCMIQAWSGNNAGIYFFTGTANKKFTNCSVTNTCIMGGRGTGIWGNTATEAAGSAISVSNCLIVGTGSQGILLDLTSASCVNTTFMFTQNNAFHLRGTGTVTATLYNCIFQSCAINGNAAITAQTAATITENYNTIFGTATARSNVTAGANSVVRPMLHDPRWFFEALNGGRLITPFDLASYSTLVEYNSGTGAPATDLRGKSVVGTYREWGALEYNANYRTQGPVSIAPIGGIG